MSCMKTSVCTEPSIEIVNHQDEISSRCTVKVRRLLVFREEGTAYGGAPRVGARPPYFCTKTEALKAEAH